MLHARLVPWLVPWFWLSVAVEMKRPLCEMNSPNTPVAGFLSQGNLVLDAGCRYRLFEPSNAAACLSGKWLAVTGSSNALLQFNNLVNFLAPDEYFIDRTGELIGVSAVVDVVIVNGKVTHWGTVDNHIHDCHQVDLKEQEKRWPACRGMIQDTFKHVPAYDEKSIRLTFFTSFFWKRTVLALQLIEEDSAWKAADFGLVTQIGAWYKNCCYMKFEYCPRKELLAYDIFAEGGEVFKAELEESLPKLQAFCGPGGRARLGCNLQTISYTNDPGDKSVFLHLNKFIVQGMEPLKTSTFRLVDFFTLGGGMPEEVYGDHASQMLNIWGWVVQLNTFCPKATASDAAYATFTGTMCTGMEARYTKCPRYFKKCSIGNTCEKWECMNSVPCTFSARSQAPLSFGKAPGLCEKSVNASVLIQRRDAILQPCHQIWCDNQLDWSLELSWLGHRSLKLHWLLTFLTVLVAMLVYWNQPAEKLEVSKPKEPKESKDQPKEPKDEEVPEAEQHRKVEPFSWRRSSSPSEMVMDAGEPPRRPPEPAREVLTPSISSAESRIGEEEAKALLKEHKEPIPQPKEIQVAGDKYPLGLARFLASSHVVVGHLFAKGVTAPIYFFHWGFTWVPWFFMLSGFVLFSAFLKSPKEETMTGYVMRRSTTIYPLYAFALLLAFMIGKIRGDIYTQWPTLLAESFLMQSWVPYFTENAMQMHCWFLSCLVVYWFFFKPISKLLRDLTLTQTCLLMGFFFSLPWLIILIPALLHDQEDWYKEHDFHESDTFLDFGVVMLKYHPFCYFHVFLLGMLLAKLRQLLDQRAKAQGVSSNSYGVILQFVAPCGYLALLLIFTIQTFHVKSWGYKLAARIAVLLPFQAMILFGLAGLPSLPLPLLSNAFSQLDFLEKYSYTVYIMQFILYSFWPQAGQVNLPLFLIFVYASAYIIGNCVQQPLQKWWASNPKGRLWVPFILAAIFMAGCFCPKVWLNKVRGVLDEWRPSGISGPVHADLPSLIRLDDRSLDVRLKLLDPSSHPDSTVINPSMVVKDGGVFVVARRHRRETRQHSGVYDGPDGSYDAVIIEEIWHSHIVMGRANINATSWNQWMNGGADPIPEVHLHKWVGLHTEGGKPWEDLCVVETWIPENRTLRRLVVTGPEDPKLVDLGGHGGQQVGGLVVAFDSRPPKSSGACRRNTRGHLAAVPQMYVAQVDVSRPLQYVKAYRLRHGSSDLAEKNWIPFVFASSLQFVYMPLPHYVLAAKLDGSKRSDTIYSTTHRPLHQLQQEEHFEIRGSAQAVLVDRPKLTVQLPSRHYLALIHLFDPVSRSYAHLAYRFEAEPPFRILQVSTPLPLSETAATPNGVPFAFASGLAVEGNTVVVTYGAGDRESRALVMTLNKLDDFFKC